MEVERISYEPEGLSVAFSSGSAECCDIYLHLLHAISKESTRIPGRRIELAEKGFIALFDVDLFGMQHAIDGMSIEIECGPEPVMLGLFGGRTEPLTIADDADYEQRFMQRNKNVSLVQSRTGHYLADFLVAFQVQTNGNISQHFKCAAAVVMAYKAVDLGSEALMELAQKNICSSLKRIEECNYHPLPRKNREHLLFSMLCAKWHTELFIAGAGEMAETLEEVYQRSGNLRNYFTPAYPINTSLLVYVLILVSRSQKREARRVIAHMHEVFKKAVDSSDFMRLTLFTELAKSHRCVVKAEETYRTFEANNSRSFTERVMKESFRGLVTREMAIDRLDGVVNPKRGC